MVRGMFLRMGSRAFKYLWSPFDDVSTAAVRRAGMVVTGKLSTSELAILPVVDTAIHPPTRNPWNLDHYSGGSSGGSSAALASAMLPIAVASDGAGSIRIPAAFCGLLGHKPTRNLVPNPFARFEPVGLSVIGPHARTVDDATALLDVLIGERSSLLDAVRRPPAALRVRVTLANPLVTPTARVVEAVKRVTRALESMGHHVDEGEGFEGTLEEFLPMFRFLARGMFVPFDGYLEPVTRMLREQGSTVRLEEALAVRDRFRVRIDRWFGDADLWVTPTVAMEAPRVGAWQGLSAQEVMASAGPYGAFTAVFNASGHPATTVPVWLGDGGLPLGVQLVAPHGADARCLAVARALLDALGVPLSPIATAFVT
jgi:amidase